MNIVELLRSKGRTVPEDPKGPITLDLKNGYCARVEEKAVPGGTQLVEKFRFSDAELMGYQGVTDGHGSDWHGGFLQTVDAALKQGAARAETEIKQREQQSNLDY